MCQVLGHMPYSGVTSNDYRKISFDFFSARFVCGIFLRILTTLNFTMILSKIISRGIKFDDSLIIFFDGFGIILALNLIVLASKWSEIMKYWCENEKVFTSKIYEGQKFYRKFEKNIAIIAFCVIGYGTRE